MCKVSLLYSRHFSLVQLGESGPRGSLSGIKASLAGRSLLKTLSRREFGWGGGGTFDSAGVLR